MERRRFRVKARPPPELHCVGRNISCDGLLKPPAQGFTTGVGQSTHKEQIFHPDWQEDWQSGHFFWPWPFFSLVCTFFHDFD